MTQPDMAKVADSIISRSTISEIGEFIDAFYEPEDLPIILDLTMKAQKKHSEKLIQEVVYGVMRQVDLKDKKKNGKLVIQAIQQLLKS